MLNQYWKKELLMFYNKNSILSQSFQVLNSQFCLFLTFQVRFDLTHQTIFGACFKYLKFFPAEAAGGVPMLKSIGGPLPHIKFCPTGGVSLKSAPNYLALENVICVGGTWMLDKQLIANKDWPAIEALAKQASEVKY